MAKGNWTTCEDCGVKTNGWQATNNHLEKAHPVKVQQARVAQIEANLARDQKVLTDFDVVAAWQPGPDVPEQVRVIVRDAFNHYPFTVGRERLALRVEYAKEDLQTACKTLAAIKADAERVADLKGA